jgi:Arc/MetJ-type ribon-helix-helix transcriptional regulator
MFSEEMKLTNFRLPKSLLGELDDARHALAKQSVAHLVRDALREFLDRNRVVIQDVKRAREKHGL